MGKIEQANAAASQNLALHLKAAGYLDARVLPDGSVAALLQLLYTRAIVLGCHAGGWSNRFCFKDQELATSRFLELMSEDEVPSGFVARR